MYNIKKKKKYIGTPYKSPTKNLENSYIWIDLFLLENFGIPTWLDSKKPLA